MISCLTWNNVSCHLGLTNVVVVFSCWIHRKKLCVSREVVSVSVWLRESVPHKEVACCYTVQNVSRQSQILSVMKNRTKSAGFSATQKDCCLAQKHTDMQFPEWFMWPSLTQMTLPQSRWWGFESIHLLQYIFHSPQWRRAEYQRQSHSDDSKMPSKKVFLAFKNRKPRHNQNAEPENATVFKGNFSHHWSSHCSVACTAGRHPCRNEKLKCRRISCPTWFHENKQHWKWI